MQDSTMLSLLPLSPQKNRFVNASQEATVVAMSDIRHITDESELYPPLLREVPQAPKELFVRGNVELLQQELMLAVVGSRKASHYGKRCVEKLLKPVVQAGVPLVSGLAYGIDSLAHKLCLEHGVPTVAVLGSGIDDASVYPRAHIGLAKQIVAAGGAVVAEYPPETPGFPAHFPERNRIIAGLSAATLVVQAADRSGSLITARLALESGRDVLAVPGAITDELAAGTNKLIRDGATPVLEALDIFDALGMSVGESTVDALPDLTDEQLKVFEVLESGPVHIDTLVEKTTLESPVVAVTITELELLDVIEHVGGQRYARK